MTVLDLAALGGLDRVLSVQVVPWSSVHSMDQGHKKLLSTDEPGMLKKTIDELLLVI